MKNLLLSSLLVTSVVFGQDFQAQKYTWQYAVQAKDATNLEALSEFNVKLRNLIGEMNENSARSEGVDVYQKFLIFIKEVQEAIAAGANLFGSVALSQEPIIALVEDVIEDVVQAESEDVASEEIKTVVVEEQVLNEEAEVATSEENVASVTAETNPVIVITFSCTIVNPSQEEIWSAAIATFQTLANKINNNEITADELVASLTEVYTALSQLENAGLGLTAY